MVSLREVNHGHLRLSVCSVVRRWFVPDDPRNSLASWAFALEDSLGRVPILKTLPIASKSFTSFRYTVVFSVRSSDESVASSQVCSFLRFEAAWPDPGALSKQVNLMG